MASHPILAHLPRLERTVTAISKHFRQQFKLSDAIREAFSGASVRVVETERARLRTRDQKLPRSEYERRCALAEYIDGYLLALELLALRAGATEFKCCLANDTDLVYVDYIVVYADLDDPVIPVSKELSRARKAGASVAIMGPSRSASAKGVHGTLIPVVFGIWDICRRPSADELVGALTLHLAASLVTFTSAFLLEHHDAFDEILDRAPDERCVNLQVWLDPSALASGGPLALRYPSGGNSGPAPCHDLVAALAFIHGRLVADGQGNADLQLLSPLQGATPKLSEGSLHASMPMCTVPFDQLDLHLPFDDQEQELAALVRGSELLLKGHLRFRRAIVLVTEEQKATAQLSGMHTCELLALEDFKAFADGSSRK